MAADGRSLITSVGQPQRSLWVHDSSGDRPLLIDGYDSQARASADGKRVYCLVRQPMNPSELGIAVADVASSRTDRLLADSPIVDFDVSRDEQQIAFTARKNGNEYEIWLADLDRRSPPRLIVSNGDRVRFGRSGDLVYRALSGRVNYLNRIDVAGRTSTRAFDRPIFDLTSGSPDGEWVTLGTSGDAGGTSVTLAVPVYGGEPQRLCHNYCLAEWSLDGRYFLMEALRPDGRALAFSLAPGKMLPPAYPGVEDVAGSKVPGVQILNRDQLVAGPSLTSFVFEKVNQLRNLYRVKLR